MDFDLQVKMFTDQLVELIEQAKFEASQEFANERSNWEQIEREYKADISALQQTAQLRLEATEAAEQKYMSLQAKLSALV
jgi:hypothetical protein